MEKRSEAIWAPMGPWAYGLMAHGPMSPWAMAVQRLGARGKENNRANQGLKGLTSCAGWSQLGSKRGQKGSKRGARGRSIFDFVLFWWWNAHNN